jgi:hypothetical protein
MAEKKKFKDPRDPEIGDDPDFFESRGGLTRRQMGDYNDTVERGRERERAEQRELITKGARGVADNLPGMLISPPSVAIKMARKAFGFRKGGKVKAQRRDYGK